MDIAEWLRGLGLGQYEATFREAEIGFDVLAELTDADLGQLGVSLGNRKRLLKAVALRAAAASQTPAALVVEVAPAAERRQLTVMFCDLVGSTALSSHLDPEDMRGVIGAYHRCCASLIEHTGGYVAKYMGDGVLAYFGYPQAHEDDAERAVQAGLAIVDAIPKLETVAGSPLHVRVGIATGIVVVGDLLGSGAAQERSIVGDTPNLAARLQGLAEADSVVIAETTRRLLGNLFELADLGLQELKGIAAPTRAWAALRANSSESRFEALHASGLTAVVGREEESELLLRRWLRAKSGEGEVVLLCGEAGIGKSRLTVALLERLANEPHARLRYFCSPQHTDSALYPIIGQLERAAGLTRDDTPSTKLDKLDALLAQRATSAEDAALVAEMLSLSNDGRYPTQEWAPEQRRRKTLESLVAQTESLARQNPVLMIFEDAHWADPTSLEVLGRLIDRIETLPVLLLVTFRPEFLPPWTGRSYVTFLTINRLTQRDVVAMIDRVVGNKLIPTAIRHDIIERTDGIPLFVEEMTKAVLEAESEGAARRTAAAAPSPALAVPASLHASLMARLDRLGAAKEAAQVGAAIGREFPHALLAGVLGKQETELAFALDRLINAGLLFRQGVAPHATYLFKHALVQDAAYGTLLRDPRRALHARIAELLESQFPDIADSQPELLARHFTEAGVIEKAAGLWGRAGQQSLARSALSEAVAQFERALAQLATLPFIPTLRRDRMKLLIGLATALTHVKGYAAPETKSAFRQARELIEQAEALGESLDDPLLLFTVLHGFWLVAYVAFNGDLMCELATEFLALAEHQSSTALLVRGHNLMGTALMLTGDIAEARAHFSQGLALYAPAEHRPLAARLGTDVRVSNMSFGALNLWLLGYPEAAQAYVGAAVREAREIGHAATLMQALGITNYTNVFRGDWVAASAFAGELVVLAEEKGALLRKAEAMFQRGFVLALTGKAAEAVRMITLGVTAWRSTGATCWTPLHMCFLARAHASLGQFNDAWRCIDEALAASSALGETWCEADIHRIAGKIVRLSGAPDAAKAEAYFERALVIARQQQAKSFELRAAMCMARLWRDQGKRRQARELLAPIYGWFTEGFGTRDLKHAKVLLDELGS